MGNSLPLRKTIDILIAGKRKFDPATNHELYITYITPHSGPDPLGWSSRSVERPDRHAPSNS